MKKAVVFPINYDNREIIQYSSLIEDYTIVLGIVLEKFSDDTFPDDKVLRYSDLEIESIEFDTIIFLSRVEDYSPDLYSSLINKAINLKKEIVITSDIYELFQNILKDYEKTVIIKKNKEIEDLKNNYDKQELKMLKNIRTPIISVIGMGDYCNKFSCELELRKFFVSRRYKVLQIGSKNISFLFGFENLPDFLYQKDYSLEDKAFLFNYFVSFYEERYQPDVILIGIPGGILPVNNKILNGLGEIPFAIMNSIKVDIGILCIYHNAVENHIIDEYIKCCKYRFNTIVDNILVSNTAFTFDMDRDMRSLKYYHLKKSIHIDNNDCKGKEVFSICNAETMIENIHNRLLNGIDVI